MTELARICGTITENVPGVFRHFGVVIDREPWSLLRPDSRVGFLGELIVTAATLALRAPEDEVLCGRLVRCAARHGEERLRQGLPDSSLFQEIYMVRDSLWSFLRDEHPTELGLAAEAIIRVDMALTLAAKASIRGYHRAAFEQRGGWPSVLDELAAEWDPPPPREELCRLPDAR